MEENGGRVATLNIKNVSEKLYSTAEGAGRKERRSVSQEVLHILDEATKPIETLSILELRGLGKDLWEGIEPAAHVDEERQSRD